MVTVVDSLSEKGRPKIMRLVTNAKGCLVSYTFCLLKRLSPVVTCRLSHRSIEFPDVFTRLRVYMSTVDGVRSQPMLHTAASHGD